MAWIRDRLQHWPSVLLLGAIIAGLVALASFFIPRAHAADLPARQPAVSTTPLPSIYTWQGAYAGLMLGYGAELSNASVNITGLGPIDFGNSPHGFSGGGRLGYDWQLGNGGLVYGLVTDISLANFNNSELGGITGAAVSAQTGWWGTTNVRAGVPFANQLLYATVGGAYGNRVADVNKASASDTSFGWDGGIGIEGKFTKNISAFIEGKYVDLGSVTLPLGAGVSGTQPFRFSVVQGGVNFHF